MIKRTWSRIDDNVEWGIANMRILRCDEVASVVNTTKKFRLTMSYGVYISISCGVSRRSLWLQRGYIVKLML